MNRAIITRIVQSSDALKITWQDGNQSTFHYIWLRDNAPNNHFSIGKEMAINFDIPLDVTPIRVTLNGTLDIEWADDGNIYQFDLAWLRANAYKPEENNKPQSTLKLWRAVDIIDNLPIYSYPQLVSDEKKLRDMLQDVNDLGFAILQDVEQKKGMVLEVVELFGYVRESQYGKVYDLRMEPNPKHLSYTNLRVPAHVDGPYRHAMPTVQLIHSLVNSVDGGESTLVDGIFLAEELRRIDPTAFQLLATTPVTFRYGDDKSVLEYEGTIIETNRENCITGVRMNPIVIQPFYIEPQKMKDFYAAYQQFGRMTEDDTNRIVTKLDAGNLLLFKNQRILHGREEFKPNKGERYLQGCYSDADDLGSKLAVLNRKFIA